MVPGAKENVEVGVCRLCFHHGRVMLKLTPTPIANSFPAEPDLDATRYPLEVQECLNCGHVQLRHQVQVDWIDYRYATPHAVRPHLESAAAAIRQRYPSATSVVEIGSNNGLNLEVLRKAGLKATGVDPCAVDGIKAPFGRDIAKTLEPVDLIVANNVLAHVDDLYDVFRGIDVLLKDDGALVFEVQYLPEMMARGAFDMIYHEHRDYHTLSPLPKFLKQFGLVITDTTILSTHGGSIRVYCERPGTPYQAWDPALDWKAFRHRIDEARTDVLSAIYATHGTIAAFGATAKACTLIHHFGLGSLISYVVDDTPAKQGRFIPGTNIPIFPTAHLKKDPPAAVLMTAWNYESVLREKYPKLNWIVPFSPSLQEVA